MINKEIFVSVILSIFILSCSGENEENMMASEESEFTLNEYVDESVEDLQFKVFNKGDTNSYLILKNIYLDFPPEDFLFWAFIMSNKYDYNLAHLDVFYVFLNGSVGGNLNSFYEIDPVTQDLMKRYLNKAVESGLQDAKDILEEINTYEEHSEDTTSIG